MGDARVGGDWKTPPVCSCGWSRGQNYLGKFITGVCSSWNRIILEMWTRKVSAVKSVGVKQITSHLLAVITRCRCTRSKRKVSPQNGKSAKSSPLRSVCVPCSAQCGRPGSAPSGEENNTANSLSRCRWHDSDAVQLARGRWWGATTALGWHPLFRSALWYGHTAQPGVSADSNWGDRRKHFGRASPFTSSGSIYWRLKVVALWAESVIHHLP